MIALAAKIGASVLSMLIALLLQRRSRQKTEQADGSGQTAETPDKKEPERVT